MRAIIHKTLLKIKSWKFIIIKTRQRLLGYLIFLITGIMLVVTGMVLERVSSLRDTVTIIYPGLPKNSIIYLPESERSILINKYNNLSSYVDDIEPGAGNTDEGVLGQSFVASKNGSRYYPVDCKSSSRIKPENKIYFNSADDAQRAGLTLASGCSL
jgi:hypothetical protein